MMPTISPGSTSSDTPCSACSRRRRRATSLDLEHLPGSAPASASLERRGVAAASAAADRRAAHEHRAHELGSGQQLLGRAVERISPFSMKTARSAMVSATLTRLLDEHDGRALSRGCARRASSSCSTTAGASPSDSSSIMQQARLHEQRLAEPDHLLLAAGQVAGALVEALAQDREERRAPRRDARVTYSSVAAVEPRGSTQVLLDRQRRERGRCRRASSRRRAARSRAAARG